MNSLSNTVSVALIDPHPVTLAGLLQVFAGCEYQVTATGATSQDILAVAERHQPGLMIIDLAAPGQALAAISAVAAKYPALKIVAFSAAPGVDYAVSALEAGARGYVSKSCTADELMRAARSVVAGETYVSQNFANSVITALRNSSVRKLAMQALKLSVREDQIIHLLLDGKTNKEIAARLGISEKTVKHYMTVLMQKLNARNRVEAVIAAQRLNTVQHDTPATHYRPERFN